MIFFHFFSVFLSSKGFYGSELVYLHPSWCPVAVVKRLPIYQHSAYYIFLVLLDHYYLDHFEHFNTGHEHNQTEFASKGSNYMYSELDFMLIRDTKCNNFTGFVRLYEEISSEL